LIAAVVAHVYFEWIHPFGDGNGRTGRLIELKLLLEAGVPQPAAHLLSNHYNATRPNITGNSTKPVSMAATYCRSWNMPWRVSWMV
jgi:hypothetical protein